MRLRLLSYNIQRGGVGREHALADVIRACAPHVVLLQEATVPSLVEGLARATGMRAWGARRGHSLAFICRSEVAHYAWHHPRGSRHAFLEVLPSGLGVRFFGVHLSAVHAAWTERRRVHEMRALVEGLGREHAGSFHMVAGDFNTLAPGEPLDWRRLPLRLRPFVWLSGGTIRWRTIQVMLEAGYVDGFRHVHPDDQGLTFPVWDPHVRLDYVFVPAAYAHHLKTCDVRRDGDTVRRASDHFPLMAEVDVPGAFDSR